MKSQIKALSPNESEIAFFGPEMKIDRIFRSMEGPGRTEWMALDPGSKELSWIVGARAVMVEPQSDQLMSQDYMCHTNIAFVRSHLHIQRDLNATFNAGYLFTISQGQEEVHLPEGFGIPVLAGTPLMAGMQALNLNDVPEEPFGVRHRVSLIYRQNSDLKTPMKPLIPSCVGILKPSDESKEPHSQVHADMSGGDCLVSIETDAAGAPLDHSRLTGVWDVETGREVSRMDVTDMFGLPYDTTIHYVFAHVHPFAESLELKDLTSNISVLKLDMTQAENKVGLSRTEHFTSVEGLPVYKDHKYELVCVYNNTSDTVQSAMAVMQIFVHDPEFVADDIVQSAQVTESTGS